MDFDLVGFEQALIDKLRFRAFRIGGEEDYSQVEKRSRKADVG